MFNIVLALVAIFLVLLLWKAMNSLWVLPIQTYKKLRSNGFDGPNPTFPLGNYTEMRKIIHQRNPPSSSSSSVISHDIYSFVFPFFSRWQSLYGKVFIYWLGTEPFLYTADPEFLRKMASIVKGKDWGKPSVFRKDRLPLFGNGLVMLEGQEWLTHRRNLSLAFSPPNLQAMASLMLEATRNMVDRWGALVDAGKQEIDVETELSATAGEMITAITFGLDHINGKEIFEKLRSLQNALFSGNRYVGVPFSSWLVQPNKVLQAKRLGKDIDGLILSVIKSRKELHVGNGNVGVHKDLLGYMLPKNGEPEMFSERELLDECKTFFFGGHETTSLSITWTLLILAMYPTWQDQLREEVKQVIGDGDIIDANMLSSLTKMRWVESEVMRLYPPVPNTQRQLKEDISIDNNVIPKGINIWIDVLSMHHDKSLWGDDVKEFKPERFKDDPLYGGCNHKMGFLPFGFGGRMCVGRNLAMMEYKIVLSQILTRFSISISSTYLHSPAHMLSIRPAHGLPLIFNYL